MLSENQTEWSQRAYEIACDRVASARRRHIQYLYLTDRRNLRKLPDLDRLPCVKTLHIDQTKIVDISAVSELAGLIELDADFTLVADLSGLSTLSNLTKLHLRDAPVTDVSHLRSLTELEFLNLAGTKIANVEALAGLDKLIQLNLARTKISNIEALRGLKRLTALDLGRTNVTELSSLQHLVSLERINISQTSVHSLECAKELSSLKYLDLSNTMVSDLGSIARLTKLEVLNARRTRIADLRFLSHLTELRHLDLAYTGVSDISSLSGLQHLESINLTHTYVSDLSPLAFATSLIDAVKRSRFAKGLEFEECPLNDSKLIEISKLKNPERTTQAINYLRTKQGLPEYDESAPDNASNAQLVLREDPLGASARVEGDHVVLVLDSNDLPEEDENETAQAHKEIIRKARALKEDCCGLGNYPGWKRLEETAGLFLEEIDCPFSELGKRSVTLWSLSVSLGSFLEQNREAQNDTASLTARLEPNVSRALGDLVVTTANFVRIFETPRKYDAGLVDIHSTPAATEAARQIADRAGNEDVLRRADAQILSSVLSSTAADGVQTRKAHGFGLKSVRNIVVTTLAFIWGGGIKKACENHVESSALTKKLTDFMDRSEDEVLTLYEDAAPDIREAVREVLTRRRDDK